jgi:hypothetical protein
LQKASQAQAAEKLNVSTRSVASTRKVLNKGSSELVRAVERVSVSVSVATPIASLPIEEQRQILAQVEPRLIVKEAQKINAKKAEKRHAERIAKLAAISSDNSSLPTERRYPVVYADAPWSFRQGIFRPNRSIENNHYPAMATEDICKLPVGEVATDDAILFLWTTLAHLPEALEVMTA